MDKNTVTIIAELAKRMSIMVIDSNTNNLAAYKDFLESFFIEVSCIANPRDAYIKWAADTEHYDLIVISMDHVNPGNAQLFKRIRKKSYEQKIIIALENNNYNELHEIIAEGIDGIIKNPKDKALLFKIFYRALRSISDHKLLNSYITQLGVMAKDNTDLRIRARHQATALEESPVVQTTPEVAEKAEKASNSLIEKYKIRTSFKDDETAEAIRDIDIFSMEKIDVFREKIDLYYQQLTKLDNADAATTKSVIVKTTNGLLKIIEVINTLNLFPVTVQAAFHMATFLNDLDPAVFEDDEKKHHVLDIFISLFDDLDKWIQTVFIDQNLDFVNYFDASFANTCLELESTFSSEPLYDDDDALEFF